MVDGRTDECEPIVGGDDVNGNGNDDGRNALLTTWAQSQSLGRAAEKNFEIRLKTRTVPKQANEFRTRFICCYLGGARQVKGYTSGSGE